MNQLTKKNAWVPWAVAGGAALLFARSKGLRLLDTEPPAPYTQVRLDSIELNPTNPGYNLVCRYAVRARTTGGFGAECGKKLNLRGKIHYSKDNVWDDGPDLNNILVTQGVWQNFTDFINITANPGQTLVAQVSVDTVDSTGCINFQDQQGVTSGAKQYLVGDPAGGGDGGAITEPEYELTLRASPTVVNIDEPFSLTGFFGYRTSAGITPIGVGGTVITIRKGADVLGSATTGNDGKFVFGVGIDTPGTWSFSAQTTTPNGGPVNATAVNVYVRQAPVEDEDPGTGGGTGNGTGSPTPDQTCATKYGAGWKYDSATGTCVGPPAGELDQQKLLLYGLIGLGVVGAVIAVSSAGRGRTT